MVARMEREGKRKGCRTFKVRPKGFGRDDVSRLKIEQFVGRITHLE